MNERLDTPVWRHDAYTLRQLRRAVSSAIDRLVADGSLRASSSTVVDMGAGDAPYRPLLAPHVRRYIACDVSPGPHIDLLFPPGGRVALRDGSADAVVSFQVLEHVWDLDAYLDECRRLIAPGGRLLLSTHGAWLYHPHPSDFRRWTRDGLRLELETRGFEVIDIEPVVGPLAWTTQFRVLGWNHLLGRLGSIGAALAIPFNALMYLRMRMEDRVTPVGMRSENAAVYVVTAKVSP